MKVAVTEEEKSRSYYKYFLREMTRPAEGVIEKVLSQELSPEDALRIQDKDLLFEDGYLKGEYGWCVFEDGTATVANLTAMPRVTADMLDWYWAWHGLEALRYKIWDPEEHYSALTLQREQCLNPSLSYKERYWNTCQDVVEGFLHPGRPEPPMRMIFRNPADVGYSREKLNAFEGTIICGGGIDDGCFMTHFFRPTEGDGELRSRFWMGWKFEGTKPVKTLPDGERIDPEILMPLLKHTIREFTNLAAILPDLYAEEKDNF
jgi:hypothetical protein